ncbi:MAG: hypothetical protein P1U40_04825 [Coxiellaceae bacterium]|nr:hypothetical protein [Coxiellaceae bacterium]
MSRPGGPTDANTFRTDQLRQRPRRRTANFSDGLNVRVKRHYKFAANASVGCYLYAVATHLTLNAVLFGNLANLTTLPAIGEMALRSGVFTVAVIGALRINKQDTLLRQVYFDQWLPTNHPAVRPGVIDKELTSELHTHSNLMVATMTVTVALQSLLARSFLSGMEQISLAVCSTLFVLCNIFDTAVQQDKQLRQATVVLNMPAAPAHRP